MTLTIPLWTLIPLALGCLGLWLVLRRTRRDWGDFLSVPAGLACLTGAALFLLGRWLA